MQMGLFVKLIVKYVNKLNYLAVETRERNFVNTMTKFAFHYKRGNY